MKALLIFAFVLCFFFSEVRALECYQCINRYCGTLGKQICMAEEACWSSSYTANNDELLRRKECVFSTSEAMNNCESINQLPGASCYMCEQDLCNEAW